MSLHAQIESARSALADAETFHATAIEFARNAIAAWNAAASTLQPRDELALQLADATHGIAEASQTLQCARVLLTALEGAAIAEMDDPIRVTSGVDGPVGSSGAMRDVL